MPADVGLLPALMVVDEPEAGEKVNLTGSVLEKLATTPPKLKVLVSFGVKVICQLFAPDGCASGNSPIIVTSLLLTPPTVAQNRPTQSGRYVAPLPTTPVVRLRDKQPL